MAFNYTRKNAYDYDTVKKAQADLNANSTYNKSEAVLAAERLKNEHEANKVANWTGGTYGEALKNQMNKIENREKFSYDLNGDALYQQYKDQYINQGKLAMQDTMGQAAAMTGGYGNSYAQTVGNQAYQGYLSKLNEVVPELYQMALNQYNQEGQDMKDMYSMLNSAYANEYGEYRDKVSDWQTEQNRLDQNYYNESQLDYSKFSDNRDHYTSLYNAALDWATSDANTDYANRFSAYQQQVSEDQWAKNYALEQAQLKAQKEANNQSSTIASLKEQLAQKNANSINADTMNNTYYPKFKQIYEKYVGKYGVQNGSPKAWEEIEKKINSAADEGKISEAEYNYLMDRYVGTNKYY